MIYYTKPFDHIVIHPDDEIYEYAKSVYPYPTELQPGIRTNEPLEDTRISAYTALYLMQNLFEEGDVSIRDFRPEFEHPAPVLYDDSTVHYTLKYLIENNVVDINEYTIYSTLRDPYERIVSRAFYKDEAKDVFMAQKILSKGYVDEVDRDNPQSAYIVYNDEVKVKIIDYDNLQSDLHTMLDFYGKQEKYPLNWLKSDVRPKWATVQTIITPMIKSKIDEVFAEDVALWNAYKSIK